jgi:type I restriction enzyme S subunit
MSVPKLRFPEFRDAGEWEEYVLADIALEKFSNGVFNDPNKVGKGYKLVNVLDMYIESYIDETKLSLADISDTEFKKNKVENGDIFFTRSSLVKEGIAKSNIYLGNAHDITFDGHLIRLRPNKNITLPLFLHFGLRSEAVRSQLVAKGKTATMTTIGQSDIADTKILIAKKIEEQKKIADCLTSIADRITAETQKLATLKAHKKGLTQQLFPAEGETLPKLRFPEFRDHPEWINTFLGKVSKITSGGTPNRSSKEFWQGNIPWVTTSLIDFNIIDSTNEYISEIGLKSSSAKLFPKNTILMAMYGQGKTRGKVAILGIEATTNQACAAILLNQDVFTSFVFQNLASRYDEIRELSNAGGQKNLSSTLIETIHFSYPKDKKEQKKIADCFSSLDQLITAQTQKIATLKTHKKGLMQQLFPSVKEVEK